MRTKEWLKAKRKEKGYTQRQLAKEIGISPFTIEQIEQGKRLGAVETWEKIETFLTNGDDVEPRVSYESDDLIEELKQDIEEFGEDNPCILVYRIDGSHVVFTNYDFITKENPFDPDKELDADESYIETTFKYALEVFEKQNEII